jgi:hypothetical protein
MDSAPDVHMKSCTWCIYVQMPSDLKWFALLCDFPGNCGCLSFVLEYIQYIIPIFFKNGWYMSADFSFATISDKSTRLLHSSQQLICPGYKKIVLRSLVVYTTYQGFLLSNFLSSCVSYKSFWFAHMVLPTIHKIRLVSQSRIQSVTLFTVPSDLHNWILATTMLILSCQD